MKKTELLNRIATLLGGCAAEELIFWNISTGAHNDLAKAQNIARSRVNEYGISAKVGQVYFATEKQSRFLNLSGHQGSIEYSDATAQIIDHEFGEIIKQHFESAQNILESKKTLLKKSAELLLEKETIKGQTIEKMIVEEQTAEA